MSFIPRCFLLGGVLLVWLSLSGQPYVPSFHHAQSLAPELLNELARMERQKWQTSSDPLIRLNRLIATFHDQGYLEASIDSLMASNDTLHVWIHGGSRYSAFLVEFSEGGREVAITAGFRPATPGRQFSYPATALRGVVDYLNQRGYPLASVSIDEIRVSGDTITTSSTLDKGPYYTWDSLEIKGDLSVQNVVLQKMLRVRTGEPYNNVMLNDIERQIRSIPWVTMGRNYSIVLTDQGKARIILHLSKEKASAFNGIIGFGPDAEDPGKILFSGDVALKLVNALSLAEEMEMKWNGIRGDQALLLNYRQPYLPLLPFGFTYQFDLLKKGELYYTLSQKTGIVLRSGAGAWFTTYVQWKNSKVLDRELYQTYTVLPPWTDYQASLFGVEYNLLRLDHLRNPGRGWQLNGNMAGGRKKILDAEDIPDQMLAGLELNQRQALGGLQVVAYFPLTERWILRPSVDASWLYSKLSHENELFRIGGINSIRGFDERSIIASAYTVISMEIRYRFEKESHFRLFFDGGWYEKRLISEYMHDTPFGFGAGVAIPSAAGMLQLNYAFGVQQGNPLDLRDGRIHVGLVSAF